MCGRYVLRRINAFRQGASFVEPEFEEFTDLKLVPQFNIAPAQNAPIVCVDPGGAAGFKMARWGFVPFWTTGKPKLAPINAKSETAASGRMFKQAMERRRCLIPADGFYEPKGTKTLKYRPWYFFQLKEAAPFAFGGIWERWKPEDGEPIDTFAILTTTPNQVVAECHDRMPVIVPPAHYQRWIDSTVKADAVADLLAPSPAKQMEGWHVSDAAKSPRNQGESLIEPVASA